MYLHRHQRDRWLLSYADFITLLFATFVLMYVTEKTRAHIPSREPAILHADPVTPAPASQTLPPPAPANLFRDLQRDLELERKAGVVAVNTEQRGIVIALDDKMCFRPGQADLQASALPMFEKVARILSHYQNRILLEGHTDSVPVHNSQFHSNWELSTARSIAVMELMQRRAELPAGQFLIGGSADNAPVSSNETEQGRARNRRVDIVVLDNDGRKQNLAQHPVSFAAY
jgi:chemotaxis protein MotB